MLEQRLNASQMSASLLQQRLDALERQLQQLVNQGEVNGHRVSVIESDLGTLRKDINSRLAESEIRPSPPEFESAAVEPAPAPSKPRVQTASASTPDLPAKTAIVTKSDEADPGEDSYSEGFHLWNDGKYDQAITALRAFTSAFPKHRRVSFANNLIGRSLLDKGQPRAAAEALLANYRSNPRGERAPDSLYYLGQALVKLKQPGQACKAYAELEEVYSGSVRADLRALVAKGKADANCS